MSEYLSLDKIPSWVAIHHFAQPVSNYKTGREVVDLSQKSLWVFVGMVAFNPIFWNIVARNEYRNKTITKIVGSPYIGCYLLAITIFSLSGFRDTLFLDAVRNQPAAEYYSSGLIKTLALGLFSAGQLFVISSMWVLGVTGTYLGDYFGILMSHRVTGFPFNVLNDPMYIGSFLTHLGTALWFQSPVGVALSFWVLTVYLVALKYEGPFTDKIYSAAHKKSDTQSTISKSTPTTPRKSSRIASRSGAGSASETESYAQVAAHAIDSTAGTNLSQRTPSTKQAKTPRKSRSKADPSTDSEVDNSNTAAGGGSYAAVAGHAPGSDAALASTAPTTGRQSRKSRMSTVRGDEASGASPMRMTRSRSKGRGLGESETDEQSE